MRKGRVVGGTIFLVLGVMLLALGFFYTPWLTVHDTTMTMPDTSYWMLSVSADEYCRVHCEYTTSDEVRFYVFDEHNYELFQEFMETKEPTDFDEIYIYDGKSQSYTFAAPEDDEYYVVLMNFGDNDVNASVKILTERVWLRNLFYLLGIIFLILGVASLVSGFILKPKKAQTSTQLTDAIPSQRI